MGPGVGPPTGARSGARLRAAATSTGQRTISIRYSAAALSVTRPAAVPGFDPITTRPAVSPARGTTVAPSAGGERGRGLPRARVALLAHDRDRVDGRSRCGRGGRPERPRPRSGRLRAGSARTSPAGRARASSGTPSRTRSGRRLPARRGRGAPPGVEPLRTTCCGTSGSPSQTAPVASSSSASCRASFSRAGLRLQRVADVGERERAARPREQPPERERVGVVRGAVVRDDDLRGHGSSRFARDGRSRFAGSPPSRARRRSRFRTLFVSSPPARARRRRRRGDGHVPA